MKGEHGTWECETCGRIIRQCKCIMNHLGQNNPNATIYIVPRANCPECKQNKPEPMQIEVLGSPKTQADNLIRLVKKDGDK